ncbi:hypothetical protein [Priestia aryabhattai]|uniref:hypothetical protein n=1 Tax=Priestia aryabhattai TaxID=412384 RepID=UPI001C8D0357|nr:hypothetical protein [Priestia aryabhattai]MBY0213878.1 hypothetical protein [Priestia aryabhattai]
MSKLNIENFRETLKTLGHNEEEVEKAIKTALEKEKEQERLEKEEKEKLKSAEEAAIFLKKELGGTWSSQKVRQLMREGKLQTFGNTEGKKVQKRGHKFHVDTLKKFADRAKLTREQLEDEITDLKRQVEDLKQELAAFKEKQDQSPSVEKESENEAPVASEKVFDLSKAKVTGLKEPIHVKDDLYKVNALVNEEEALLTFTYEKDVLKVVSVELIESKLTVSIAKNEKEDAFLQKVEKAVKSRIVNKMKKVLETK